MVAGNERRVTILALLFFTLIAVPNLPSAVFGRSSQPIMAFEPSLNSTIPSPAMPLPAPTKGYARQLAPVSGVIRVLMIAVAFSDIPNQTSIAVLKQEYFGTLSTYYHEVSLGTVTIQGDAYGWYKLPYPEAHYGKDCLAIDDADCSGADQSWQIAQDAAQLAQKNVNFQNYDYYVFLHSGDGQESSGVKNDVWSVTYLGGVYVQTNTKTLIRFNIIPELEAGGAVPDGVWCHEFGHNLGLPDLYNTSNGQTILGPWELMDKGLWNGNPAGSSPAHMSAWPKLQLGFISGSQLATANIGTTSTFTIDPTEIPSSNIHVIEIPWTNTLNPSQYYLVEVRSPIGFDSALPAAGVLITSVDNTAIIGKVHVIDGHPSVPSLEDAVWYVGQTFTDSQHNVAVTVAAKVGNSYQVIVNRGGSQPPPPPNQNKTYINLGITAINAQPQVIISPNTTVTVTVQITNLGTEGATNVPVEVDLDGQLYTNTEVSAAAGSATQTSFTWISVLGSHVFKITIDPNHTINNTNTANNVASVTLNVGPVLTINVPANVTSAGSIWVLINGVRYNLTSGQLQTSVPSGTITVQVQPAVNTSLGVRELFGGWSDGNLTNPRQIVVTSNTALQAVYATQYLLSINQNGGTTTPSGWYFPGTVVQVNAANPSNVTASASRLIFAGWNGDLNSTSTSLTVNMSKPLTLSASWTKQYYVTIISPTGSPTGSGWYDDGNTATVAVQSTVQFANGTRKIFAGWNATSLGNNPTAQVYVDSPTTLQASWETQYAVTIQSEYGTPLGSGWYDVGSTVPVFIQTQVDYGNGTRRSFASWTGDYTGTSPNVTLRVDTPKTLTANWNTEYLVIFKVAGLSNSTIIKLNLNNEYHDLSMNSNFQTWYQRGTTVSPTLNQTIVDGFSVHQFSGWRNATGGAIEPPRAINSPETFVASYSNSLSLPPIPGFPIESTILGVLIGSLMLAAVRRRRPQKSGR
ncbi:MAG: M6 family metalloprotease domain-containing protein [Candidatus Bathyarchaeia archaeon]|jgi:M6 family metalloprotease-like protein